MRRGGYFEACALALALGWAGMSQAAAQAPARFSQDAFALWLAATPTRGREFAAFETHLAARGVAGVAPAYQLWRTSSSSAACNAEAFVAPPQADWDHIVGALEFVRDAVIPAIGPVEAVSAYRDQALNACSGGARASAHRGFWAVDLTPLRVTDKAAMVGKLCAAHAREGAARRIGLGFYAGLRFHIDALRFRRWGPDGTGATSPCNGAGR